MAKTPAPQCALCTVKDRICRVEDGSGPDFCPTVNCGDTINRTVGEYNKDLDGPRL